MCEHKFKKKCIMKVFDHRTADVDGKKNIYLSFFSPQTLILPINNNNPSIHLLLLIPVRSGRVGSGGGAPLTTTTTTIIILTRTASSKLLTILASAPCASRPHALWRYARYATFRAWTNTVPLPFPAWALINHSIFQHYF